MKKALLSLIIFCSTLSFSQLNISRDVVASSGSEISNSNLQISYTIGETFTANLTTTTTNFAMGFQQGDLFVASVNETEKNDEFLLYPNPAGEQITLKTNLNSSFIYNVYDISGRIVMSGNGSGSSLILNLSSIVTGKYFIEYIPESGENQYLPFIKSL